jgi:hypothetical protein
MKSEVIWQYRKFFFMLAHLKWLLFKAKPEYHEGSRVIVRFRSGIHGTEEVLCRISGVSYRFHSLTYDLIVLEDKGWLPFGTRTFVFPENILRKQPFNAQ